jgi:biopolymer transport protein ExbD/biopolymer transport protein TolR
VGLAAEFAKPTYGLGIDAVRSLSMGIVVRDEGKKVNSNINVTPMVDVMLVLLIIFMVITPMLQHKVNVNLAQTKTAVPLPDANHSDSVQVAITRDGKVYLGANQVALASLGQQAQNMLKDKPSKIVYIRADRRAHYGIVMNAIDDLRTAGVDQVAFLTEPNNQEQATPTKVPGAPNPNATKIPGSTGS